MGCTNFKLRQLTRLVTQHYDQHLGAAGLKITQYSLLAHVDRLGPVRPASWRGMDMRASTLTRNLQPLVAAGLALALGSGPDARNRLVHITPEGVPCAPRPNSRWKAAQLALNDRLGSANVGRAARAAGSGADRVSQPRRPRLRARRRCAASACRGELIHLGQQPGQGASGGLHQGLAFGGVAAAALPTAPQEL